MRDDPRFQSCAVEIKVAKNKTLYRKQISDHQIRALTIAHTSAMYFKIPDGSFSLSPFDGFILKKSESYVVIYFSIKPKSEVWAISIENILETNISIVYARSVGLRIFLP